MRGRIFAAAAGLAVVASLIFAVAAWAPPFSPTEHLVSPTAAHFPQNKQNESTVAVNPLDGLMAAVGANDLIREPDCTPATGGSSSCPFAAVDTMGVYITSDGGSSWTHQILDATSSTIYQTDGDPALAWGPKPSGSSFSYGSGARLYAATLLGSSTFGPAKEQIGLFYSDNNGTSWTGPIVISTRDNPVSFNDKLAIAVDANAESPNFGNVYVSWTLFTGNPAGNFGEGVAYSPEPIVFARSTDGGDSFSKPVRLTASVNNGVVGGRQGSTPEVAPNGDVYVFWDGSLKHQSTIMGARSTDGGVSFGKQFLVSTKTDSFTLPGSSFRNNSFPNAAIGPNGELYVVWPDYAGGHGVVKLATSTDHGANWNVSTAADVSDRSAFFPAVAVNSSNHVLIGFNALTDVTSGTAPGAGVVHYDAYYVLDTGSGFSAPIKISAAPSDPDVASANSLGSQFIGDYNGAAAGPNGTFWFTWTDTRNGATCAAVDAYRTGGTKPNIYDSCPAGFGNSDIYVATIPTPSG